MPRATSAEASDAKPIKPTFKIPNNLATCADRMYEVRHARYALQKQVDALQAEETALREHLIENLPKSQASGIAGKIARATVENRTTYQVEKEGWPRIHEYIVKNYKKNPGVFALLQRRLGTESAKEMWAAGVKVPGVVELEVPTVSLNKL